MLALELLGLQALTGSGPDPGAIGRLVLTPTASET